MKAIGFKTVSIVKDYNKALGSARLRCYDLLNFFRGSKTILAELYNAKKCYDTVVFQKLFNKKAFQEAQALKDKGVRTVFDIGTNYLELDSECVSLEQKNMCLNMLSVVDYVSVSSPFLKDMYSAVHKNVHFIDDAVEDKFLQTAKTYSKEKESEVKLIYCGYSNKAHELNLIKKVLLDLYSLYKIKLLYITDRDPGDIVGIPYEFIKFDYAKLPSQLIEGDIKVSPRDLSRPYNKGHSVVKIAYPMSIGLPAVVSPIPSYLSYVQSENICYTQTEWYTALEHLIKDVLLRRCIGLQNKEVVKNKLCLSKTGLKWETFFEGI